MYVGGLSPHKNLPRVIEAFARDRDHATKLVLVGDFGDVFLTHIPELRSAVDRLGLDGRVIFAGERTDVGRILEAADIGVHASHTEGFSNAVIEAMTAGLPMVVTDVGGNAEAVIDGEQGFVVPAMRPDLLAAALERLAREPELRRRFGDAARSRAERHFSLSACVDGYEALYRGLLAGKLPGQIPAVTID